MFSRNITAYIFLLFATLFWFCISFIYLYHCEYEHGLGSATDRWISPLPIMSYGGSALLATMIGFSIVMSCKIYDKEIIT